MLEPHCMDLDPTWALPTFCTGFCSSLHSQKVSTATATSHHIASTSEIHNTSEVNFAQRPVMLNSVHLRAVACSPWYQGQSWNCFLGILHNVYFSSFCPFSASSYCRLAAAREGKGPVTMSQQHGKGTDGADPVSLTSSRDVPGRGPRDGVYGSKPQ